MALGIWYEASVLTLFPYKVYQSKEGFQAVLGYKRKTCALQNPKAHTCGVGSFIFVNMSPLMSESSCISHGYSP